MPPAERSVMRRKVENVSAGGDEPELAPEGIPAGLVRFIAEHVSSLEELEVMVLLRASAPREWSADEVSRELGSSVGSMRIRLAYLVSLRILVMRQTENGPVYRHGPVDAEVAALIDGVVLFYKERRLAVIDLVYGRPESDIHAFSDAFRLKK